MIEQAQLKDLLASPVYSLLIDETSDIAIIKEMVIYARFIIQILKLKLFLKMVELTNGCAETKKLLWLTLISISFPSLSFSQLWKW